VKPVIAVLALLLALALALVGYQTHRADKAELALAQSQRDNATATAALSQKYRVIEAQTRALQQGALDDERLKSAAAQAALVRARNASLGMRDRAAVLARQCSPAADPAPGASSAPADTPGDLLAGMLGRIDEAAGAIGEYADKARIAGQACERSYDAITNSLKPVGRETGPTPTLPPHG